MKFKSKIIAVAICAAMSAAPAMGQGAAPAKEKTKPTASSVEIKKIETKPAAEPAKKPAEAKPADAKAPAAKPAPAAEKPAAAPAAKAEPKPEPKPEKPAAKPEPDAAPATAISVSTASSTAILEGPITGSVTPSDISVQNDFIKIVVNTMDMDTGRFLARTVKGDPFRDTDDDKILVYGGAVPWTSFLTLRIDGESYVFGGQTKRRAGRDAKYGEVSDKPRVVDNNSVVTKCKVGGLDVVQTLSIVGGPVSGILDTVKITTVIRNPSGSAKRVGARLVIDTLLGSNDASPFKVGDVSITQEQMLQGAAIPEYWIAYDSLENPGVVARGTLIGEHLTPPDRMVFTNWGKLADNVWDFPFSYGQSFKREDESDMDSAIGLYWDEVSIAPGAEIQYSTLYGIEYLNIAGDVLSIGAQRYLGEWPTAKNQIRPYTLYAYIGNTSKIDLNDVEISIELPDGVSLEGSDDGMRKVGLLTPGMEKTVGWTLVPQIGKGGERNIILKGSAREVQEVKLKTSVTLLPPPEIITTLEAPAKIKRVESYDERKHGPYGPPFSVRLKCANNGRYFVDNLSVKLLLPEGLVLPTGIEKAVQSLNKLGGGKSETFAWNVMANGTKTGALEYIIIVESDTTEPKAIKGKVFVDSLPVTMMWTGLPPKAPVNSTMKAELFLMDVNDIGSAEFSIKYNPDVVEVIRIEQGTVFVGSDKTLLPWTSPKVDRKAGIISGIHGTRNAPLDKNEGSLIRVHFITTKPGESAFEVLEPSLKTMTGENVVFDFTPATLKVE